MANAQKGEYTFTGPDGNDYTLLYNINAMCLIEDELGVPMSDLEDKLQRPSAKDLRAVLWAGLKHKHPDLKLEDAGAIASGVDILENITAAFSRAFPDAPKGDDSGNAVAEAGTGG